MTLDTIRLRGWPFDLAATLDSGQVFHWVPAGAGWAGAIGDVPVYLEQPRPDLLRCTAGTAGVVSAYLALDHDMERIVSTFPADDGPLQRAIAWCPGLRLLRQPKWECLATFILSSLKQVPHIRRMSLALRQRFGRPLHAPGLPAMWAWPEPEAIARAGGEALRECGLGYRAGYLHATAVSVAERRVDLESLSGLPENEAAAVLQSLPGVGAKIAACALLFGWEMCGAFPVDVWIDRVLRRLYFNGSEEVPARQLHEFARNHFGPYRGYAQQFLFHHARKGLAAGR